MATKAILLLVMLSIISVSLTQNAGKEEKNVLWSSLSPLTLASMEGRAEEVENILQQKYESPNRSRGMSPLHWAALRGHLPVIRVLLRFNADIRSLDDEKNTVLHMAAAGGSSEAVQELVLAKADLNAQNIRNSTALHLAVNKEDFEVVKKLLRFGALTNITDDEGRSPLDLAIERNNLIVTALLRSSGAQKIKYGKTTSSPTTTMVPATTTTRPSLFNIPKATRKPDVRELTGKEKKLHEAAENTKDTIISELCSEGVDPNVADIKNNGKTALHLAAANNGKLAVLTLARCSANLNVKDFDGNTPLHIAVIKNNPWSADMLLMLGANSSISNNEGKSPKDLFTPSKNSGFIATFKSERIEWINNIRPLSDSERNLLRLVQNGYYWSIADSCRKGVDVRVKDADHKQYTMLHYAVSIKYNVPGTIQILIRCGADINARDADGNTPLHLAVLEKQSDTERSLLLNGADPSIANAAGKTAYQMLKESSPDEIDSRLHWYRNSLLP